jgi:hypothetical protein
MRAFMPLRNNKFWIFVIIFLLLLGLGNIQAQDWQENVRNVGYEFLGATTGNFLTGAAIVAYAARSASEFEDIVNDIIIGWLVGGSVGAPAGTIITGNSLEDEGSYLGAYTGGIIGTGLGSLSIYLINRINPDNAV